ncbi:MAG: ATP-binding cassette domain-containing protein [Sporolactobacillus sp.]
MESETLLSFENVSIGYNKSIVINGINLQINAGQKLAILGRNGVGKTTLMKGTIGILPISTGSLKLVKKDITRLPAHNRSKMGIAYVPQGREIFPELTVKENLELGGLQHLKTNTDKSLSDRIDMVTAYFPELKNHLSRKGGLLSGGQQQQLSIARALMSYPKMLLLDEPTDGIQPNVVNKLVETLNKIQEELNIALIVVEQNLNFASKIVGEFLILQKGKIVEKGKINELTDEVKSKYLSV